MEDEGLDMLVQLACSALLLPGLSSHKGAVNCLNAMEPPNLLKRLDGEERRDLLQATAGFFMASESSASEHGQRAGLRTKT